MWTAQSLQTRLKSLIAEDLKRLCRKKGIEGFSKKNHGQLVALVAAHPWKARLFLLTGWLDEYRTPIRILIFLVGLAITIHQCRPNSAEQTLQAAAEKTQSRSLNSLYPLGWAKFVEDGELLHQRAFSNPDGRTGWSIDWSRVKIISADEDQVRVGFPGIHNPASRSQMVGNSVVFRRPDPGDTSVFPFMPPQNGRAGILADLTIQQDSTGEMITILGLRYEE